MRHAFLLVLGLLSCLLACRAPSPTVTDAAQPPETRVPETHAPETSVPETRTEAPAVELDLEGEVDALVDARLAFIDAEETWTPEEPVEGGIKVFGRCVSPTAEQRDAARARVMSWVKRKHRDVIDTDFVYGCVEVDRSLIVTVWVTVPPPERTEEEEMEAFGEDGGSVQTSYAWVLRVTPHKVVQLFSFDAPAILLLDADADGILDAATITAEYDGGWELGGNPNLLCEVVVSSARGARSIGGHPGYMSCGVMLKRFVADDGKVIPVLALDLGHQEPLIYRCFSAAGPWVECAAGQALARRDRGRVWAEDRHYDRESLAEGLALLGIEPNVRTALVERAQPSTSCEAFQVADERRVAARAAMLPSEQAAAADVSRERVVAATFAELGLTRCAAPTKAQLRTLEAQARALRTSDTRDAANHIPLCAGKTCKAVAGDRVQVTDVCVGPSGTTWVATWPLDEDGEPGSDIMRSLLVHSARGTRVLVEASAPTPYYADECRGCSPSPLITTKSHLVGSSIVGLVARAGDAELRIVVDDRVAPVAEAKAPEKVWHGWQSGFQSSPYDEGWRWPWREPDTVEHYTLGMDDSPLLREVTGEGAAERVTFWVPSPTGLVKVASFTMSPLGERGAIVIDGTATNRLKALLVASERRRLVAKGEAGCAEALELLKR